MEEIIGKEFEFLGVRCKVASAIAREVLVWHHPDCYTPPTVIQDRIKIVYLNDRLELSAKEFVDEVARMMINDFEKQLSQRISLTNPN